MVKRKKNGPGTVEEEKHHDEGISANNSGDSDKPVEIALESTNSFSPPISATRNRVHVTRTATKETQNLLECSDAETTGGSTIEKNAKILTVQRSSNRVPKRMRKEPNSADVSLKKTAVTIKQNAPQLGSKTRRPWELWSVEDKNAFFEALCEYGKDFESIQSYIAQRSKKKGTLANMIKNKDQVRHFYYRTWHKISKYLEIGEDVRKQTQELYGLINYAELRKKIGGCLNEKNRQKLNELVFNGVTTVKYKGKKLRIKTPVCRALKKLNNVAEPKEPEAEKLPKDIVVELRPLTNQAWLYVQNLAQNPRVRTKLSLQRRLKTVIEYLQQRWKPYRLKKKEQILSSLPQTTFPPLHHDPPPVLRIKPKNDASISLLTISAMDNASSSDVCLEKYIKISREHVVDKDTVKTKKGSRLKPKLQNDSVLHGTELQSKIEQHTVVKTSECLNIHTLQTITETAAKDSDKSFPEDNYSIGILTPPKSVPEQDDCGENPVDEAQRSLSLLTSMLNPVDKGGILQSNEEHLYKETLKEQEVPNSSAAECKTLEEMYFSTCQASENLTLGQLLGLGTEKQLLSPEPEMDRNGNCPGETLSEKQNLQDVKNKTNQSSFAEAFKNGWTAENAGLLTLGELYLMLGRPSKIMLEYVFEQPEINPLVSESIFTTDNQLIESTSVSPHHMKELAEIMRRLIQVASSMFVDFKNKQTPLSPTSRNAGHTRVNNTSQATGKASSRSTSKSTNVKTNVKTKSSNVNEKVVRESPASTNKSSDAALIGKEVTISHVELCSTTNTVTTICSDGSSSKSDKHVFVVPVGTAPRTVKIPTQESLKEEMDKLLPGTRRGCRVRRKPLVVQRPLLPREGMGTVSGPRPMTVVHLVPSGSQLTAVIPSSCASNESKTNLPSTKKVMKILSTGPTIDVRPLQVPLIKQVNADSSRNVILQPSAMSTTHLMMTPVTSQSVQAIDNQDITHTLNSSINNPLSTVGSIINSMEDRPILIQSAINTKSALADVSPSSSSSAPLTLSVITATSECVTGLCDKMISSSPPQISIPDTTCTSSSLSPGNVSSFLEISLDEGLSTRNLRQHSEGHLLNFSENSNLSAFGLTSSKTRSSDQLSPVIPSCLSAETIVITKENTPPQSPPSRPFRINSPGPEAQWLNGESVEFSLNTLLNTVESPGHILPVSSSVNLATENSNLDPIARLAPVVDSQVRCLLDECSIDFIAKFEDLADVINSSNTDSKQT